MVLVAVVVVDVSAALSRTIAARGAVAS